MHHCGRMFTCEWAAGKHFWPGRRSGGGGESLGEEKSNGSGEDEAPGWDGDPEVPSFTGLTFTSGTAALTSSRLHLFSLIEVVWPVRGNTGRREKKSGREFGGENSSNSQLATTLLLLLQTYSTNIKVEQSGFVRSLCLNNIHQRCKKTTFDAVVRRADRQDVWVDSTSFNWPL